MRHVQRLVQPHAVVVEPLAALLTHDHCSALVGASAYAVHWHRRRHAALSLDLPFAFLGGSLLFRVSAILALLPVVRCRYVVARQKLAVVIFSKSQSKLQPSGTYL